MTRPVAYLQSFPCLQAPEVKRAWYDCEKTLSDNESLVPLEDSFYITRVIQSDTPEWWDRYANELSDKPDVFAWFSALLNFQADPVAAFETSARGVYALAGLTEAEIAACLPFHRGVSFRTIARRLQISLGAVQDRIRKGELKLAHLKEL